MQVNDKVNLKYDNNRLTSYVVQYISNDGLTARIARIHTDGKLQQAGFMPVSQLVKAA